MPTVNLGRVRPVYKGDYSNIVAYRDLDIVRYQGALYLCIQPSIGNLPTNLTYFTIISEAQSVVDILAALLTIDGAGSGLDADLLDGKDSSAFLEKTGGVMTGALTGPSSASETVAGLIERATSAEVLAGTDAVRAVTPKGLLDGLLGGGGIGVSEYVTIPFRDKTTGVRRNLIIQWGYGMTSTTNGGDSVIPYPITFPGDALFALAGYNESAAPYNDVTQPVHIVSKNKSTITVRSYTGGSNGVNFMVIGY